MPSQPELTMTENAQQSLIDLLKGAQTFHDEVYPKNQELFFDLAEGQSPATLFITCADSRINPSMITQTKPGELFIVRNVGNIVPPYGEMLGGVSSAIEYAVGALGITNIVVCGHSNCGAMGALMDLDSPKLDKLPTVKRWLRTADTARAVAFALRADDAGPASVQDLAEQNVLLQLTHLRTHPLVAAALASNKLTLQGWFYDIAKGTITVLNEETRKAMPLEEAITTLSAAS